MECYNNGCNNNSSIFYLIILLFLFGNNGCGCGNSYSNGCDNGCGMSVSNGCGNACAANNGCGCGFFGGDSLWIILLILFCGCR